MAAHGLPVDGEVLIATPCDAPTWSLADWKVSPHPSLLSFVSPSHPRTLLIHGCGDHVVPLRHSQLMHTALRCQEVDSTLVVLRCGHPQQGNFDRFYQPILDWLNRLALTKS